MNIHFGKNRSQMVVSTVGQLRVSPVAGGLEITEVDPPQGDAQAAPARTETRGRKPRAAVTAAPISEQPGTMFTPPTA